MKIDKKLWFDLPPPTHRRGAGEHLSPTPEGGGVYKPDPASAGIYWSLVKNVLCIAAVLSSVKYFSPFPHSPAQTPRQPKASSFNHTVMSFIQKSPMLTILS